MSGSPALAGERRACSTALLSLIVLVIQNSLLVVMTRFSRGDVAPEDNYYTSTLILNQEVAKMVMCLVIFAYDEAVSPQTDDGQSIGTTTEIVVVTVDGHDVDRGAADGTLGADKPTGGTAALSRVHTGGAYSGGGARASLEGKRGEETDGKVLIKWQSSLLRWSFFREYLRRLRTSILKRDTVLLLIPQMLFTMQNFLIFVGLSNLDAVSFQVWSQTKLLSAAVFSVWLLGRHLSRGQWFSLALLTIGVLATQLGSAGNSTASAGALVQGKADTPPLKTKSTRSTTTTTTPRSGRSSAAEGNELLGVAACVLSGLSSSYAGVYFEKVVKTTSPTLAIRNIQLSLFGIPLALLSMLVLDVVPNLRNQQLCGQSVHLRIFSPPPADWQALAIARDGAAPAKGGGTVSCPVKPFYFWQHYDVWLTWGLVGIHAFGGLLVAIVVRYADNILKGFATGVAVIVSGLLSSAIWGYEPTIQFVLGAVLVTASTVMFHKLERKR